MPSVLDPRIITLTKQTRIAYRDMMDAENAFCAAIGTVGFQREENRQKLIFAARKIDADAVRQALLALEERRAEYLENAKADEAGSRDKRDLVGPFETIGDQSTSPPRFVGRSGLVDITSGNLGDILAKLKDRADFVKLQEVRAYRIGTLTLAEALAEVDRQITQKLEHIHNSRSHGNHARARLQEDVLEQHRAVHAALAEVAARADADALHVRIRSGTGSRFRARFPGIDGAKWHTVPFTIANVAVVAVQNRTLREVAHRTREADFVRVAVAGLFEVFERRQ